MNEKKNDINYTIDSKAKSDLYSIYTNLLLEINLKRNHLEIITTSSPNQLIHNIKQLVPFILNKSKESKRPSLKAKSEENDIDLISEQYESLLRKTERTIRLQYRTVFQQKIRVNYIEAKLEEYMKVAQEFKQMKSKLKYEEGKFMNDDRKDNEIIILRAENSNVKASIARLEKSLKESESQCTRHNDKIGVLNLRIEYLNDSIAKLKQYCELNTHSNTCNNTNIHTYNNNNPTTSSKLESKQKDEQYISLGNIFNDLDKDNSKKARKIKKRNQNNSVSMKLSKMEEVQSTYSKKNSKASKTVVQLVSNFKLLVKQRNILTKNQESLSSLANFTKKKKNTNRLTFRNRSVSS